MGDTWNKVCEAVAELEEKYAFQEMGLKKQIEEAVFMCSCKTKYELQTAFPQYNFCILATDICEDGKLYMVTDETLANNIRRALSKETQD